MGGKKKPARPANPKYTWKQVLVRLYKEFGRDEITSREVAGLLDVTIHNASMRLTKLRRWDYLKHARTKEHGVRIYTITNRGVRRVNIIKKEMEV